MQRRLLLPYSMQAIRTEAVPQETMDTVPQGTAALGKCEPSRPDSGGGAGAQVIPRGQNPLRDPFLAFPAVYTARDLADSRARLAFSHSTGAYSHP